MILEALRDAILPTISNTYIGEPPAHVRKCLAIRYWGGDQATEHFGVSKPLQRQGVLMVSRGENFEEAAAFLETAQQFFHKYSDSENGIAAMFVRGNILYLGRSEEHVHEFQLLFKIIVKE